MQLPRQNPNHLSILVVEDCEATNLMIQEAIGHEYLMTHVWTVQDAHLALSRQAFDLILLDVTLPDGTGFNFAEQLQHSQHNPPPFIFRACSAINRRFHLAAQPFHDNSGFIPFHFIG